jgi:hypothetical protein
MFPWSIHVTANTPISSPKKDKNNFTMLPKIVWAKARDPYDVCFWSTVMSIAGEDGECFLSIPDLAILAMMSESKVIDCRKFLINKGLLEGEIRKDIRFASAVWHLRVPNLWSENSKWSEDHKYIESRIAFKKKQHRNQGSMIELVCQRCQGQFEAKTRRSKRCPDCQAAVDQERRELSKRYGRYRKILDEGGSKCSKCNDNKNLEFHLEANNTPVILCEICHDDLHRSMNDEIDQNNEEILPDEVSTLSDEISSSPEKISPSPDKIKNIPKKIQHIDPKNSGLSPKEIWEKVCEDLKESVDDVDYRRWIDSAIPTSFQINTLSLITYGSNGLEWFDDNKSLILKSIKKVIGPDADLCFCVTEM